MNNFGIKRLIAISHYFLAMKENHFYLYEAVFETFT